MSSGLASALYNFGLTAVLCYHCITACNIAIGHMLLHDNLRQVRIQYGSFTVRSLVDCLRTPVLTGSRCACTSTRC